ncbi:DctP family TRAP transporter solute-binding subunit [Alcaligenes sp. SDU_A2]|uniref:DctP family TRAP transporter solute-binding subunit n=1 Tax=Alcaligenes sp. SDU_A2 TaxID=3136634 RepID=UPI002C567B08|nr:DctP family TRAP transporter solute-binding subunit [Alcaligenes sp.]HRL26570.1 DctP family TRAP transporter solute-binding subunit [Alcaligenes sp.]
MKLRHILAALACTAATLAAVTPAQAAYKSEYKLSIVVGTTFPWGQGAVIWSDLVRERTDGRINIKIYPGTSLVQGDQTREFTAIRQGLIDMAVGSTINWSPQIKQLNLFSLPFLQPDAKATDALIQGEVGKELFGYIEKAGVVPLAWGENGFRQLSNSKHVVSKPEDMKGLKLRVVGSPLYIDTFTALGANPTQMSWADAQPALASKAVDGQENPLSIYAGAKLYDVQQQYLTLWNYVSDPLVFVVNRDVWKSWSPEDQKIVREAAIEAGKREIEIARKGITAADPSLLKEIEGHGVTITRLTPEQHQAFTQATAPVVEKWTKTIGEDLVKKAREAIAQTR